jgi:hypothetical protein
MPSYSLNLPHLFADTADDLDVSKIRTEVGNSTQDSYGKVKVHWEEPEEPNGIIVAYILEYRRVEVFCQPRCLKEFCLIFVLRSASSEADSRVHIQAGFSAKRKLICDR